MSKTKIICFTGIDGSGKTAHAFALLNEFKKRGKHCKYTWCRWSPGLSDVFHFVVRKTVGYVAAEYRFCKPLQMIFPYLKILDFAISIFFKVRLPVMLGRCVIIDRYVYDALADLHFLGFDTLTQKLFIRLFIAMNPKPDVTFLIDVPPKVALSRKSDISLIDAMKYEKIYNHMAKIYFFQRIVNIDFSEAHSEVLNKIIEIQ